MAKRKRGRRKATWQGQLLALLLMLGAVVFLPTTILALFGMMPTIVASLVDKSRRGTKALTVGAMNLAGCSPFLIHLWTKGNTRDFAVTLITDPRTIIVIYSAAAVGYLIDWALSGIVATLMVQRSTSRLKEIEKRKAELVERWGREVTGEFPLDQYGFPLGEADTVSSGQAEPAGM